MDNRVVRRATLVTALALLPAPAPAAAADRVLTNGFVADAEAGVVLLARPLPGDRLALFRHYRGTVTRLAAASFPVLRFPGATLGTGSGGQLVAAWGRCSPRCDIFGYGFTSRRERRFAALSTRGDRETAPSVWRGRVLFARSGRRGGLFLGRRRITRLKTGVTALRGRTAAFSYSKPARNPEFAEDAFIGVKRIGRLGRGRVCTVWANGADYYVTHSVSIDGDYVYWATDGLDSDDQLLRRRLPDGHCRQRGRIEQVLSVAAGEELSGAGVDRGRVVYSAGDTVFEHAAR